MNVFKYTAKYGPQILQNRRIKVSTAHTLNDPFELSPSINSKLFTLDHMKKMLGLKVHMEEAYAREGTKLGFTNKKRFKAEYFRTLDQRARKIMPKVPRNVQGVQEDFATMFSDHWRLFCASAIPDSILMWSHYGSEHTGMVIEFDTDQSVFKKLGKDLIFPVKYCAEKADFFYNPGKIEKFTSALINVVARKAPEWSYESEVRMMFPKSVCIRGEFVAFEPTAVRSVIFGCRCPSAYQKSILDIISHKDYAHIEAHKYHRSETHYRLDQTCIRPAA